MKKLSVYSKYNIGRLVSFILFVSFFFTDNFVFALLFPISFVFYGKIKCPKCGNYLGRKEDNFVVTPFQGRFCNKCHIDLSKEYGSKK